MAVAAHTASRECTALHCATRQHIPPAPTRHMVEPYSYSMRDKAGLLQHSRDFTIQADSRICVLLVHACGLSDAKI